MIRLADLSELVPVSNQLLAMIEEDARVWSFYGEMGAGKTTLIKALCDQLGVTDAMSSPTFSIINEYSSQKEGPIYHFDFYRIENQEEAQALGLDEYFYSGNYCFVEWPEKIRGLLPPSCIEIHINLDEANNRLIDVRKNGEERN